MNSSTRTDRPWSERPPRAFEIGYFEEKNLCKGRPVIGDPGLPSHFVINLPRVYKCSDSPFPHGSDLRDRDDYYGCVTITSDSNRHEGQLPIGKGRLLSGQRTCQTLYQAEGAASGIEWRIHSWRLTSFVGVKPPAIIPRECYMPLWKDSHQGSRLDEASVRLLVHHLNERSKTNECIPFLDPDKAVRMLCSDREVPPLVGFWPGQFSGYSSEDSDSTGNSSGETTPGPSFSSSQVDTPDEERPSLQVRNSPPYEPRILKYRGRPPRSPPDITCVNMSRRRGKK
ncbi:hypothetical protein MMC30_000256 [Trapelia coarctata]|nr:hypothetical protein [Trapelia coarctata]